MVVVVGDINKNLDYSARVVWGENAGNKAYH